MIAALLLPAGIRWVARREWWRAGAVLLGCGMLTGAWIQTAWVSAAAPPPAEAIEVVFWNIARGRMGYPALIDRLRSCDADLIGLVESGRKPGETQRIFETGFPGYAVSEMSQGITVLVRGKMTEEGEYKVSHARYRVFRCKVRGLDLRLMMVDVISNPLISRREPIEQLTRALASLNDRPLLVMGDFNTPTDSIFFGPWRNILQNGFASAGRGFGGTWPTMIPLQPIDQVWFNSALQVGNYRLTDTLLSDHRLVRFALLAAPPIRLQ
jgi:hypothetical protein